MTDTISYYITDATYMGPSPYLGDEPNPEYYKTLSGNNALSDFNGLSNTQTLVELGLDYEAANACWNYNDGVSNIQWYLPAAGELGYIMPRFKEINNIINQLGGNPIHSRLWTSTEFDKNNAYDLQTDNGAMDCHGKLKFYKVRPFAII